MTPMKRFNDEETMARNVLQVPGQMRELIFLKEQLLDLPVGSVVVKTGAGGFAVADGMLVIQKHLVEELRGLLDDVQELETQCDTCHELKQMARVVKWFTEAA
jgi:hypothetical protein